MTKQTFNDVAGISYFVIAAVVVAAARYYLIA